MKTPFEQLRAFVAGLIHPKQNAKNVELPENTENHEEAGLLHVKHSHSQQGLDPYAALSEVAAPGPVEQLPKGELPRHPSLEQHLSNTPHPSGNHQNKYEALSEIAAPEPVKRHTEAYRCGSIATSVS
ncbi:hypothetical protein N7505_007650 [Penicillium chrysogenum]|uniref:Uncharacterized protein n=1 Tax=Penicillium chrysogenum TaxID=5076 RepID=A0ABQ8WE15_PENCH|nr:hypothetical protein N7505_007650 [Penicillium chrysogenum]